jgi:solute carrier family 25 protein 39/40
MSVSGRAAAAGGVVRRLWTGVGPALARDVPYSALYWFALEHLRTAVITQMTASRWHHHGEPHDRESSASASTSSSSAASLLTPREILGVDFFSGVVAGGTVAALTTPLDVVGLYKFNPVGRIVESAWFQPLSLYSEKPVSSLCF